MTFANDITDLIKFAFSWVNEKSYWTLYLIFAVLYFFISLFDVTSFTQLFDFQTTGIMIAFAVVLLYLVVITLLVYFSLKLLFKVMPLKFSKVREFSISTVLGLIAIGILELLAAVFSVFELKWLVLLVIGIAFAIGAVLSMSNTILAIALGILAALPLFLYFVIVMRNSMRLFAATGLYLEGGKILESLSVSWNMTCRKALKIFALVIVELAIIYAFTFVELVPQLLAGLGDMMFSFVGIPIRPLSALISAIFSPALVIIQTFFFVGIYAWIKGSTNAPPVLNVKKTPTKSVRSRIIEKKK